MWLKPNKHNKQYRVVVSPFSSCLYIYKYVCSTDNIDTGSVIYIIKLFIHDGNYSQRMQSE